MNAVAQNTYKEQFGRQQSYVNDCYNNTEEIDHRVIKANELVAYVCSEGLANKISSVVLGRQIKDMWEVRAPASIYRKLEPTSHKRIVEVARSKVKDVFEGCLANWKDETKITSSIQQIVLNKNYQRIIGLGPEVLPYIFSEYAISDGHWHNALEALTGENPILKEYIGRSKKIKEAWLKWAKTNGYV